MSANKAIAFFLWSMTQIAVGGGWSGNGGQVYRDQDNIWFLGDEPVEYCVALDPAFQFSNDNLDAIVAESLHDWLQFFRRYGLDSKTFGTASTLSGAFPDGRLRKMALNFRMVSFCDKPDQQLAFRFGGVPDEIKDYIATYPNEIASAVRGPFNHSTYRTGGFIWFQSGIPKNFSQETLPWTRPMLKHMLLHELGHVFGMPHDSVYVMAENTGQDIADNAKRLAGSSNPADYLRFGVIESPDWHYRYLTGDRINLCLFAGGIFGVPSGSCHNESLPEEIRTDLGIARDGHHKRIVTIVSRNLIKLDIVTDYDKSATVTGTIEIPLEGHVAKPVWHKSPGVYTLWRDPAGQSYFHRGSLDFESAMLPHRGTAFLSQAVYGIDWSQGGRGSIYLPASRTWWDFTSTK